MIARTSERPGPRVRADRPPTWGSRPVLHPALRSVAHRPWPVPQRPWSWRQSWRDVLLAYWRVPADAVRALTPPPLVVEERDGSAWIGITPLRLRDVARRPLPEPPGLSAFSGLGLHLCVSHEGRPGSLVLALDLDSRLAVWAARRLLRLPCAHARIHADIAPDGVRYRSVREGDRDPAVFEAVYRAASPPADAAPGSLEHWLAERYCLYARTSPGALFRIDLHHAPWPLQRGEAVVHENDLLRERGVALADEPAALHFARRLDVLLWSPERIAG